MAELGITGADVVIVVLLLVSGLLAFARGLVHEVLGIGAWLGAAFATAYGIPLAKPFAEPLVGDPRVAAAAAGLVIFLVTLVLLSLLTRALALQVRESHLGFLDRSLGFAFGLARGVVLVCLAYIGLEFVVTPGDQPLWLRNARTMPLVENGAELLKSFAHHSGLIDRQIGAAEKARDDTKRLLETERMLRDMMSPSPQGQPGRGDRGDGYDASQRRQLDRLLDSGRGDGR